MVAPSAGEVVLVPFPFSDLSQSKLRPAICLADGESIERNQAPIYRSARTSGSTPLSCSKRSSKALDWGFSLLSLF